MPLATGKINSVLVAAVLAASVQPAAAWARDEPHYDIVVYGGTPAGVTAAIQARRMKKTVVLIEPSQHVGGLTSGGLGATDIGNKAAIGGLARTFYERIAQHYAAPEAWRQESPGDYAQRTGLGTHLDPLVTFNGRPTMWTFEPHVAERIFKNWLDEHHVPLVLGERLDLTAGVEKRGVRIRAITMESGRVFRGRMFIDATYEGDLMAKAGVSFHVGRESNQTYGETLNGVQSANAKHHQFAGKIDPYVVPGNPGSGLLPEIDADGAAPDSAGDHRVQAYNFRMTLTDAPGNRLPIPMPAGYDPQRYELLRRTIAAGVFNAINLNTPMPNRKTDINNNGAFSSDYIGANYEWPSAGHVTRERIFDDHVGYVLGLWYFLQNDPRLPADVRAKAGLWGLCKDEFVTSNHFPHQLYVREARRMVSAYVMTEHDCRWTRRADDSIGLGAYGMDSHNVRRHVKAGAVVNEGDVQVPVAGPYPIAYRSIVPRAAECDNLLVPVALSASHIAYGSIRMEPVFMVLGQSAATAAALAVDHNQMPHAISYRRLRERLLADDQILDWLPDIVAGARELRLPDGTRITAPIPIRVREPGTSAVVTILEHEVIDSPHQNGRVKIRVLLPTERSTSQRYPVVYALPVEERDEHRFGLPLLSIATVRARSKKPFIAIEPTFTPRSWFVDHASDPRRRHESYLISTVLPAIEALYPVERTAAGRLLVGFSKSGWGALSLITRHPDAFARVAIFDAPLALETPLPGEPDVFGTRENFTVHQFAQPGDQRLAALASGFGGRARLWLRGGPLFAADMRDFARRMKAAGVRTDFAEYAAARSVHQWDATWLRDALAFLLQ